jgi:hypothetical protein
MTTYLTDVLRCIDECLNDTSLGGTSETRVYFLRLWRDGTS